MPGLDAFHRSPECRSEAHCEACRSLANPTIRLAWAAAWGLEERFACRIGRPWGYLAAVDGMSIEEMRQRIEAEDCCSGRGA